ncbi:hypothetical protein MY10362_006899 [Beauveria mimosiformis]
MSSSQRSGCSSPASSASACGTFLVRGVEELEINPSLDSGSGIAFPKRRSSPVEGIATIPFPDNGDRIRALMAKYEQKKGASVSRRQAYAFDRLGGARRAAGGAIEYEVFWAPIWLPLDQFEGEDAVQEAKGLIVDLFGPETWQTEVRKLGLTLPATLKT